MKKIITIFFGIILLTLLFGGIYSMSNGFKNWDLSEWYNNIIKPKEPEESNEQIIAQENGAYDKDGNVLYSNVAYENLDNIMFSSSSKLSATSAEGITLRAVVEPVDATDTSVTWSIRWKDSSSAFASGKEVTSYVTITPNAKNCVVKCLKDFGSQIEVVCTSNYDNAFYDTINIDYVKNVNSISLSSGRKFAPSYKNDALKTYTFEPVYSNYTIDNNFNFNVYLSGNFDTAVENDQNPVFEDFQTGTAGDCLLQSNSGLSLTFNSSIYNILSLMAKYVGNSMNDQLFKDWAWDMVKMFNWSFKYDEPLLKLKCSYGSTYFSGESSFYTLLSSAEYDIPVASVDITNQDIIANV